MKTLPLRDAEANLSALVEAAERGEAPVVTRHGRAPAMIAPIEAGRRLFPDEHPSFASLLMAVSDDVETERNQSPVRDVDL